MDIQQLIDFKKSNMSIQDIAKNLNRSTCGIRYHYQKHDIEPFKVPLKWDLRRLVNTDDVDGQYVIGFLAADGFLMTGKRSIGVTIQERDIEVIYRICAVLGNLEPSLRRLVTPRRQPQAHVTIGSVIIVRFLQSVYGFTSNKSKDLPFPNFLQNPLPFLRGYFDGNGYIKEACTLSVASKTFADGLLDWYKRVYGKVPYVYMNGRNRDCYSITFRKRDSDFIHALYSYPGLTRKTLGYQEYLPN